MTTVLQWASLVAALLSAGFWLRSARVKVTQEQYLERERRDAAKAGREPNLGGAFLDGWHMSRTFATQANWNAGGAIFAAISVVLQALAPLVE